jgi:hypothetical protein
MVPTVGAFDTHLFAKWKGINGILIAQEESQEYP